MRRRRVCIVGDVQRVTIIAQVYLHSRTLVRSRPDCPAFTSRVVKEKKLKWIFFFYDYYFLDAAVHSAHLLLKLTAL